eukprot:TsM_001003000 transcript=TsM_001003000 gene=TsM_001003000
MRFGFAKEKSTVNKPLPEHFCWSRVEPHSITLSWDVQKLGAKYANLIQLLANLPGNKSSEFRMVQFLAGNVTIDKLKANTRYEVTVRKVVALKLEIIYTGHIDTPSTEYFTTTYETSTFTETEKTVVTSSGSALTSAISAILFTNTMNG